MAFRTPSAASSVVLVGPGHMFTLNTPIMRKSSASNGMEKNGTKQSEQKNNNCKITIYHENTFMVMG